MIIKLVLGSAGHGEGFDLLHGADTVLPVNNFFSDGKHQIAPPLYYS
jgi:hypothetical protein